MARTRELLDTWNENGPDGVGRFARDDVVLVERADVLERDTIFGKQAVVERFRDRLTLVGPSKATPARSSCSTPAGCSPTWTSTSRGVSAGWRAISGRFTSTRGMVGSWLGLKSSPTRHPRAASQARGALVEWIATNGTETFHPSGEDAVGAEIIYSGDGFMSAFLARA